MNSIVLTGKLSSDVSLGASNQGVSLAKARLKFNPNDDAIPVFAVAEIAEEMAQFQEGDEILVSGRLLIRGENNRVALAVDKVGPVSLETPDARRDIDFFNAMRNHSTNARVRGR